MNDQQSDFIKYVPPKCEKCGCQIVNLNSMCVPCAVKQVQPVALGEVDLEAIARNLLANEYEKDGIEGSYPTYANLARHGEGEFTLRSIRAIIAALKYTHPAQPVQPAQESQRLTRPFNEREKAVLAPPHPGDFGIPKEHWDAAKYFAEFWEQNNKRAQPVKPAGAQGEPVARPDDNKVICPACVHQFRAIPVNVQKLMIDAGFEPPFYQPASAVAQGKPVAYLHTMTYETGEQRFQASLDESCPWGAPGVDFDSEFDVEFQPLYTHPAQLVYPAVAVDWGLVRNFWKSKGSFNLDELEAVLRTAIKEAPAAATNEQLLEALNTALSGLKWYHAAFSDTVGEADYEAIEEIESAITAAEAEKAKGGV